MVKVTFGTFLMMMMVMMVVVQSAPTNVLKAKGKGSSSTKKKGIIYKIQEKGYLGEKATTSTTTDTYYVTCGSKPKGTHPNPAGACKQISNFRTGQAFKSALKSADPIPAGCTNNLAPLQLTISGRYKGKKIFFQRNFPNYCVFKYQTGDFSNFVDISPSKV
ncbi:unnamed protein product [Cunninghamella blakesleeana]